MTPGIGSRWSVGRKNVRAGPQGLIRQRTKCSESANPSMRECCSGGSQCMITRGIGATIPNRRPRWQLRLSPGRLRDAEASSNTRYWNIHHQLEQAIAWLDRGRGSLTVNKPRACEHYCLQGHGRACDGVDDREIAVVTSVPISTSGTNIPHAGANVYPTSRSSSSQRRWRSSNSPAALPPTPPLGSEKAQPAPAPRLQTLLHAAQDNAHVMCRLPVLKKHGTWIERRLQPTEKRRRALLTATSYC